MQAIVTHLLPATNNKPTRISARCANKRRIYSIGLLEDRFPGLKGRDETHHRAAARLLCLEILDEQGNVKEGTHPQDPKGSAWNAQFVTGYLPNGDFAHCSPNKWGSEGIPEPRPGLFNFLDKVEGWETNEA